MSHRAPISIHHHAPSGQDPGIQPRAISSVLLYIVGLMKISIAKAMYMSSPNKLNYRVHLSDYLIFWFGHKQ